MNRVLLYLDIIGFENLVRKNPVKVKQIFQIFDNLKVHKHFAIETVVFSDTILVFNKALNHSKDYYCTYLIEYSQDIFYKLLSINVYFKGILTFGEFNFFNMNNIQAYYGSALIDAHNDEKILEGFGLYVDKSLSDDIILFDKIHFSDKYDFILLCQSIKKLYDSTEGILPIDINLLKETDTFYRIDEDLRFFREIEFLKENHPSENIKAKYQKVYNTYKTYLPKFFKAFEVQGFLPFTINSDFTGSINPFEIISEQELISNKEP